MSSGARLPTLTSAEARQLDRLAAERFRLPLIWLMEAAGWQVARFCRGRTYVVCGKGNNGGDGLAAARHLHRWGRLAGVACIDAAAYHGDAALELEALRATGVAIDSEVRAGDSTILLDALLGTGITRPAEGAVATWIDRVNDAGRRVVSIDVPSGLNADTGATGGPTVRAALTATFGLPKRGLVTGDGPAHAGEVWVCDIGIPPGALTELGIEVPAHLFAMHDRVELGAIRL
ncbi:MAG: NAD(P)H-hydrate epimerase [Candidatus Dormibacteraeota bacterium]|nr:NAD(P)H-hydrate epimerase [Candidatus Dormibacteraeota bacterium]